ncbi:MAG TPA: hypothetical protein VKE74_35620 [Gemmataceae bacterium]|nr:hypothetical protein [Gemmataceae bacterium]
MSIVRQGLAEDGKFADGYEAIFGKKDGAKKASEKAATKKAAKKTTGKKAAKKPTAKKK